jgi:hypothetical protein
VLKRRQVHTPQTQTLIPYPVIPESPTLPRRPLGLWRQRRRFLLSPIASRLLCLGRLAIRESRAAAKDVLSVPASTISSKSTFSLAGRVIEECRRRLAPDMVEILSCIKYWELKGKCAFGPFL